MVNSLQLYRILMELLSMIWTKLIKNVILMHLLKIRLCALILSEWDQLWRLDLLISSSMGTINTALVEDLIILKLEQLMTGFLSILWQKKMRLILFMFIWSTIRLLPLLFWKLIRCLLVTKVLKHKLNSKDNKVHYQLFKELLVNF